MSSEFREVAVTIESTHIQLDEKDNISETYAGKCRVKDGELILLYHDSENRRMQIRCTGKYFERRQLGSTEGFFAVEPGKDIEFDYPTAYGIIPLTCRGKMLSFSERGDNITVAISYSLISAGSELSQVEIKIIIKG